MAKSEQIFAAVDIGTSKVVAVAGKKNEEGKIEIIGFGQSMSQGIKRGAIFNIDEAYAAISEAVRRAEDIFGGDIEQVYVNLTGQQLKTQTTKMQKYLAPESIVTEQDVQDLLSEAFTSPIPEGYRIYNVSPQLYTIDNEDGIFNPVGTAGEKIEATYKIHLAPEQYETNIRKCFDRGGIKVKKVVVDSLASSEVVLSEDEKELGVVLLDIGGGTTRMSIYHESVLCYSSVIPFGGNVITNDIKEGCSILQRHAENLKTQFGQAMGSFAPEEKVITIPGISGWEPKEISFRSLAFIIQARMEEIIDAFYFQLKSSGYLDKVNAAGIVITGGTSLMPNISQLINFHTGLNVRIGKPNLKNISGWKDLEDPRYTTVLGLLTLAAIHEDQLKKPIKKKQKKEPKKDQEPGIFSKWRKQVTTQLDIFFEENQGAEMN